MQIQQKLGTDQITAQCARDQQPSTPLHSPAAAQHASSSTCSTRFWQYLLNMLLTVPGSNHARKALRKAGQLCDKSCCCSKTLPAIPAQQGAAPSKQFVTKLLTTISATRASIHNSSRMLCQAERFFKQPAKVHAQHCLQQSNTHNAKAQCEQDCKLPQTSKYSVQQARGGCRAARPQHAAHNVHAHATNPPSTQRICGSSMNCIQAND
jgi:hypothetical protein